MKIKSFVATIISLMGFYAIFSAIITSGHFIALIYGNLFGLEIEYNYTVNITLFGIAQVIIPTVVGIIVVNKAKKIAGLIIKDDNDSEIIFDNGSIDTLTQVMTQLLGLYMLSTTIPNALAEVSQWFQISVYETGYRGWPTQADFWQAQFTNIVYHVVGIGFSLYVFLRGGSIANVLKIIRTKNVRPPETQPPAA